MSEEVQLEAAAAVLSGVRDEWLARPGVVAVELARARPQAGRSDATGVCIRVTVERLLPRSEVPADQFFDKYTEGVRVQVVASSGFQPEEL